jgi:hypothetical protein
MPRSCMRAQQGADGGRSHGGAVAKVNGSPATVRVTTKLRSLPSTVAKPWPALRRSAGRGRARGRLSCFAPPRSACAQGVAARSAKVSGRKTLTCTGMPAELPRSTLRTVRCLHAHETRARPNAATSWSQQRCEAAAMAGEARPRRAGEGDGLRQRIVALASGVAEPWGARCGNCTDTTSENWRSTPPITFLVLFAVVLVSFVYRGIQRAAGGGLLDAADHAAVRARLVPAPADDLVPAGDGADLHARGPGPRTDRDPRRRHLPDACR